MPAIAKTDPKTGATRSLVGHSLDVANAVLAMLTHSVARERLSTAAGLSLTAVHVDRLAVLAGVHDFGKASNGFQERIRGVSRGTGHVAEAVAAVRATVPGLSDKLLAALRADLVDDWCEEPLAMLYALLCHNGEPVEDRRIEACSVDLTRQWTPQVSYDPVAEVQVLTHALLTSFPLATRPAPPFPAQTRLQHAVAGLVMTADWMGSDARWHPVVGPDDRPEAAQALLNDTCWSGWHTATPAQALLGNRSPRSAQVPMLDLPLEAKLVILEAPTGTGKTEASAIWADRLAAAGLVDGMYFAVPTRSAATELHGRIAAMFGRVHPRLAARVVRAVPGLVDTDHPVSIADEPTAPTCAFRLVDTIKFWCPERV